MLTDAAIIAGWEAKANILDESVEEDLSGQRAWQLRDCANELRSRMELSGNDCTCPQHGNWIAADDVNRLTRAIDVAINGEAGAAKQASLCDVTGQIVRMFGNKKSFMGIEFIEAPGLPPGVAVVSQQNKAVAIIRDLPDEGPVTGARLSSPTFNITVTDGNWSGTFEEWRARGRYVAPRRYVAEVIAEMRDFYTSGGNACTAKTVKRWLDRLERAK